MATPGLRVIPAALDSATWPGSLTRLVVEVAGALGSAADGDRIAVVVAEPPAEPEQAGAVREAMRSLVHASVLERPAVRVNLLYGGSSADREMTLDHLATADFVLGATLDLSAPGGAR
jgi:hypothetical protein